MISRRGLLLRMLAGVPLLGILFRQRIKSCMESSSGDPHGSSSSTSVGRFIGENDETIAIIDRWKYTCKDPVHGDRFEAEGGFVGVRDVDLFRPYDEVKAVLGSRVLPLVMCLEYCVEHSLGTDKPVGWVSKWLVLEDDEND